MSLKAETSKIEHCGKQGYGATTLSITTFSIATYGIMTFSIKGLFATLSTRTL